MIDLLDFIDGATVAGVPFPPLTLPGGRRLRLSPRQRAILAAAFATNEDGLPGYHTVALCWAKGSGKSVVAAAGLAHKFLTVEHSRSVILGPSERQVASVVANYVRELLRGTYEFEAAGSVTVLRNPALGSEIVVVPRSEASVQGVRPRNGLVVVDEAHEFPADPEGRADSQVGGALHLLLSQCEDVGSVVLLLGMLGDRDGYLHWLKGLAEEGALPHCYFSYETDPLALNPAMTEAYLAQRRAEMLPALFRVHFANQAAETVGVFEGALLDRAEARGHEFGISCPVTTDQWAKLRERFGSFGVALGIDRAMALTAAADRTAIVALGKPGANLPEGEQPVFVLAVEVLPQGHSAADILRSVEDWRRRFGRVDAAACDAYQMLDVARALGPSLGLQDEKLFLLHETTAMQTQAFGALASYMRDGRLVLGEGDAGQYWRRELLGLRAKLSASLDSARFEGRPHDDAAHASALAAFALGSVSVMEPGLAFL